MTTGKDKLKVAVLVQKNDGTDERRIVSPADMPKAKRPEIYRGTDELIAKYRRGETIRNDALLRELAIAKLAHIDFGEGKPDAAIRFELLDIIATKLTPEAKLVREGEARTAEHRKLHDQWIADDAAIKQNHPDWPATERARVIQKKRGGNVDTIRKVIARKK